MADAWHLAQINVGKMVAPQGDPLVQPFFDALDAVNALAEASPGFVWRLMGDGNNATDIHATVDPLLLLNMSVWTDAESLFDFVYRSGIPRSWPSAATGSRGSTEATRPCGGFPPGRSRPSTMDCRGSGTSIASVRRHTPSPSRRASWLRVSQHRQSTCNPTPGASARPDGGLTSPAYHRPAPHPPGAGARMRLLARSALLFALAPAWAAAPSRAAEPEWTAAVTAASDYYFRGVSQTVTEPALQADLAVEHASGWFGSLFASTVGFPEQPYEDLGTFESPRRWATGTRSGAAGRRSGPPPATRTPTPRPATITWRSASGSPTAASLRASGGPRTRSATPAPAGSGRSSRSRSLPWSLGLNAGVGLYELPDFDDEYAFWHVALMRPMGRFAADVGYYGSDSDGRRLFGERADPRLVVGVSYRVR